MSVSRARRQGQVATILILVMFLVLGAAAMAVDWGQVSVARTQVQAAADAAALAASTQLDDEAAALELARAYAEQVTVNGLVPTIEDGGVEIGTWDGSTFTVGGDEPNSVRVTTVQDVPMTLTRLFGVDAVRVRGVAGAAPNVVAQRAPDIAVVLDVTGSMSTSEVASEREAAQALLDCVKARATPDSRMAIGLFTGVDTQRVAMAEVGTDYATLSAAISSIRGCGNSGMPACSGTNHAAAMGSALVLLDEAATPEGVGQVALIMSDGEPNADSICTSSNYTSSGWRPDLKAKCQTELRTCTTRRGRTTCTQNQPTNADYLRWVQEYNTEAEALEIDIYTVYYGTEPAGIHYLEDYLRAGDGFSLDTPTADEIEDAFEEICTAYTATTPGLLF